MLETAAGGLWPKVRGIEQHGTLSVERCKIQTEIDTADCQWQDMPLPYYIQISRVTMWSNVSQCLNNPITLEDSQYDISNELINDLDTVMSLLQRGVEEISMKCSPHSAKKSGYCLISYAMYNAMPRFTSFHFWEVCTEIN